MLPSPSRAPTGPVVVPGQPRPFGTPVAPLVPCVFGAPRKLWPQQPRPPLGGAGRGGPPSLPRRNAGFPPVCLFYSKKTYPSCCYSPRPPTLLRVRGLKRTRSFLMLPIRSSPLYTAVPLAPRPRAPRPHRSPLTPRGNGAPTQRARGLSHTQDGAESPSWGNHTVLPSPGSRSAAHDGPGGETEPSVNGPRCGKRESRGEGGENAPPCGAQQGCHTQHGRQTEAELVLGGRDIGIERCGLVSSARRTLY